MLFSIATDALFNHLRFLLETLTDEQFTRPVQAVGGASIGQHTRHIVEFYKCLIQGYPVGVVSYEKRVRDTRIENNRAFALQELDTIARDVVLLEEKLLELETVIGRAEPVTVLMPTSLAREVVYLAEHTVHHLALIKSALYTLAPHLELPVSFGVADSTLRFRSAERVAG